MGKVEPKVEYPLWKKVAWRYGRIFLASFLANVALNVGKINSGNDVLGLCLVPSIAAGIASVSKALREWKGSEDYSALVDKLPL